MARALGHGPGPVSLRDDLRQEPEKFDFLRLLRFFERSAPDRPRIGENRIMAEEIVSLGQDPFLAFPDANLSSFKEPPDLPPEIRSRFLGLFGPQGALPLTTTEDAHIWAFARNDPAYLRFVDLFAARFLQLYFRAWANARPVVTLDRPDADQFRNHIGALTGLGSVPDLDRDTVPDVKKRAQAGLSGARIKSAARLRALLSNVLDAAVEIRERVGCFMALDRADQARLGGASGLGGGLILGARVHSINHKIAVEVAAERVADYRALLPSGRNFQKIIDLTFGFVGHAVDFDVEISVPRAAVPPMVLGQAGELGWTTLCPSDAGGRIVTRISGSGHLASTPA